MPLISALHAHQKWKLDLLSHTSLPRGTVSISGRAITTGNRNFLNRESNGNWVVRIQEQRRAEDRCCHVGSEKAQFAATRAEFSDEP